VNTGAHETSVFAPAKINLFLHVGDKRPDGYHDICSLAVFADVGDHVAAVPADALSLTNDGTFARALEGDEDNLVSRAAIALQDWARAAGRKVDGARLTLNKNLPIASGIGGGSSDAAATLKVLNDLWRLRASKRELARIGAGLGADVPVCLLARAALMEGIGEKLTAWPDLPKLPAILVNPRVSVMTADVFGELELRTGSVPPAHADLRSPSEVASWLVTTRNDLQEPASRIAPSITDTLAEISATPGCILARMSGSGATCFGLYSTKVEAAVAARTVRERRSHWWIAATELH
jgi:4-diphosphocytidyl-2-C-methyl-D-erythritol kinase